MTESGIIKVQLAPKLAKTALINLSKIMTAVLLQHTVIKRSTATEIGFEPLYLLGISHVSCLCITDKCLASVSQEFGLEGLKVNWGQDQS